MFQVIILLCFMCGLLCCDIIRYLFLFLSRFRIKLRFIVFGVIALDVDFSFSNRLLGSFTSLFTCFTPSCVSIPPTPESCQISSPFPAEFLLFLPPTPSHLSSAPNFPADTPSAPSRVVSSPPSTKTPPPKPWSSQPPTPSSKL